MMEETVLKMRGGKDLPEGYTVVMNHYAGSESGSMTMIVRDPTGLARMNRMAQMYIEEDSDGAPHLFLRFWTDGSADSEEVVSLGRLV